MVNKIQTRIYEFRGLKVMLDYDLAELYNVPVKSLNLAVKRNLKRFPGDFMFRLTKQEFEFLKASSVAQNGDGLLRFQNETLKRGRGKHRKYLPYAFTEQGVAMLSGILRSNKAIKMNIAIMRAFVALRKLIITDKRIVETLKAIQVRITEHDVQLSGIYEAIENLLGEKAERLTWVERERIGFKN